MKFGAVPPREAVGAIVVHSIRTDTLVLKKGTVVGEAERAALDAAGIAEITVARLEPGDVSEDAAAVELATLAAGSGVRVDAAATGRSNLFAEHAGLLAVDKSGVDTLNNIDPDITFATLRAFAPVVAGEMVATVKIIPFAVAGGSRDRARAALTAPLIRIAPYKLRKIAVISTRLPGLADKVIEKTLRVTAQRLKPANAVIMAERRVPHDTAALGRAIEEVLREGAELVIVFGASAISDRRDVIPAAIETVGGQIEHFGMPVDPGNLMLVAAVNGIPVVGAPGCARSPKENGFDWILARLLCGLAVTRHDITTMGVGGLLMEIVTRPRPRGGEDEAGRAVGAVILAAGRSTRMGDSNKLLAEIGGRPLVRIVAEAALASRARPVIVVTGHDRAAVAAALTGLDLTLVHNPRFADGMSTSVKTGIAALPETVDGAVVCLADMPRVDGALIDRLIAAFDPAKGALVAVPTTAGQRGNPVVWARRFFADLAGLEGDIGARRLIELYPEAVVDVAIEGEAALIDVDTPDALKAVKAEIERA